MKNKVWLLAKIQLMRVWNPEFFKDRGLRKKRKRFLLLSLGMVGIGALIMFYSALISLGFVQMGMGEAIPVVMMGICSLLLIAISFMKSGGTLFGGKNFDMVLSLPVTVRQVVLSRMLFLYGAGFLVFFAGFLPAAIVYTVNMGAGVGEVFNLLLAVVLGPCIPVVLSLVLSVLVMLLAERLPQREIFVIVLNVAIFVGILFWTGKISVTMDEKALMNMGKALANGVTSLYPPAGVAFSFLEKGSIWGTLLFAVLSIALFWGFVILVSRFYVKINEMFSSSKSKGCGKDYIWKGKGNPTSASEKRMEKTSFLSDLRHEYSGRLCAYDFTWYYGSYHERRNAVRNAGYSGNRKSAYESISVYHSNVHRNRTYDCALSFSGGKKPVDYVQPSGKIHRNFSGKDYAESFICSTVRFFM